MKIFLIVCFYLVIILVGPVLTIWMLNTLFPLSIDYNIKTWFAAAILNATISTVGWRTKND